MHRLLTSLLGLFIMGGCIQGQTTGKQASEPGAWVNLLFDSSLRNWTRVAVPPTASLAAASPWSVDPATGTLTCEGDKSSHEWLRYDKEFANFVFQVECRFARLEGDRKYNSGIYVRNNADGTIWHQAQVGSASGGFIFGNTLVKGVSQRISLSQQIKEQRVKEAGEWNTFEIRAEGETLTLRVNGAVTSEYTACEVIRGYVGLEAEGYRIEFRNVRIRELP
jgi:hypothetical protein